MRLTRRIALAGLLAATLACPAFAQDKPVILASVPGLTFPFFVHMMIAFKAEAAKQGVDVIESDGQVSSPKQTADIEAALTKGVKGIVLSPNEVDAMAPALQEAVDANVPVVTVDRRVPSVKGILGHVGADNVKGGEAQGNLIVSLFPNGATIVNLQGQSGASPAIDRNKGLHNVLDKAGDKYKIVFEQTAGFDRAKGLSVTEAALAGMADPPQVIVAANDDMALGAMEAVQGAQSQGHRDHRLRRAARGARSGARRRPHRDDRAVPRQAERARRADRSPTSQDRQEAGPAGHAADAGRDHQGQSQRGRASQRGEVRRGVGSPRAPRSARVAGERRPIRDGAGEPARRAGFLRKRGRIMTARRRPSADADGPSCG